MFKNNDHYKGRGNQEAEKLGWSVINYILKNDSDDLPPSDFEMLDGIIKQTSKIQYLIYQIKR